MEQIIKKRQALKTFANWSELNKQTRNDIAYMSIAFITASLSKAVRSKVGAIIVKDDKKFEIANPLQVVAHSMTKLSSLSGISSEFLVGIVLINDDCNVVSIENGSSPVNIVRLRELSKFIGEYEKRPVKPFVSRQLWQAIQDLHTIKENVQSRKKQ